ncbi:WW domain-binding protein 2-like isoform X2 [Mauremys reevesii]|uniref:WW domain-binding protein 2-like isoform X2 n=1 Tax=Mauremys reevesii TaxID=260615 RepID=UPI00193F7467|nr:WW domain-binding protein 2-like isoform X2 [Mauremys reevesii]
MEVTRYQFSRTTNNSEERVLAHFSNILLVLDEMPNFPEELQGAKKGILYLTQYKMIFQHKDKGSTTIRFPLQLLGDSSSQGVLTFKFIFLYEATDCLSMIKTLSSADTLREAANLQDYPTASIYTYAHPSAPRVPRSLSTLPYWPPPYPGPPELPPPYSEVESTSPRESQEGCCHCRALRTQEQTDRQN